MLSIFFCLVCILASVIMDVVRVLVHKNIKNKHVFFTHFMQIECDISIWMTKCINKFTENKLLHDSKKIIRLSFVSYWPNSPNATNENCYCFFHCYSHCDNKRSACVCACILFQHFFSFSKTLIRSFQCKSQQCRYRNLYVKKKRL